MNGLVVGSALVMGGNAAIIRWRYKHHRSCRPRCPNKHAVVVAGNEGILWACLVMLLASLLEYVL